MIRPKTNMKEYLLEEKRMLDRKNWHPEIREQPYMYECLMPFYKRIVKLLYKAVREINGC